MQENMHKKFIFCLLWTPFFAWLHNEPSIYQNMNFLQLIDCKPKNNNTFSPILELLAKHNRGCLPSFDTSFWTFRKFDQSLTIPPQTNSSHLNAILSWTRGILMPNERLLTLLLPTLCILLLPTLCILLLPTLCTLLLPNPSLHHSFNLFKGCFVRNMRELC